MGPFSQHRQLPPARSLHKTTRDRPRQAQWPQQEGKWMRPGGPGRVRGQSSLVVFDLMPSLVGQPRHTRVCECVAHQEAAWNFACAHRHRASSPYLPEFSLDPGWACLGVYQL